MRLSFRKNFIFLSNPRCGSTTIRRILDPYTDIRGADEKPFHHHVPASELKSALTSIGYEWERFFVFTTIRNPWDRVVSAWCYADKNPLSVWKKRKDKAGTFDNFCKSFPGGHSIRNFCFEREKTLADEILKIEEIDEKLPGLLQKLDIADPASSQSFLGRVRARVMPNGKRISRVNQTKRGPYHDYYSNDSRKHVERLFSKDIEIGGYHFDQ